MDGIFVFNSPCGESATKAMIENAVKSIGGEFTGKYGKWRAKGYLTLTRAKVEFFLHEQGTSCKVRAIFRSQIQYCVRFWETFLCQLLLLNPGVDFGVSIEKPAKITAILNLEGDTQQVFYANSTSGTSLGGFLVGGALFGTPGAIVGGMSGNVRTRGNAYTVFSDRVCVRILWSNGQITEQVVLKKQSLYHEIMNIIS